MLLDTCATLWATEADRLAPEAEALIEATVEAGSPIYVSMITAWEVGMLVSRGRLPLLRDPVAWFDRLQPLGFEIAPLTGAILIASSFLPQSPLRDPADRILAATARIMDLRLMTRDQRILDYGEAGWLHTVTC